MDDTADAPMKGAPATLAACPDALLEHLRIQGGERFDPAGWHYLHALARRAAAHDGMVRRLTHARLAQGLDAFAARFAQARCAAGAMLASACAAHPHAAAELEQLFASADFKGLRYRCALLDARVQGATLAQLASRLDPAPAGPAGAAPAAEACPRSSAAPRHAELKTVRESRATWASLSVDRQLSRAMQQAPQNAGPINSHMLVLRSLAMMQAISPGYLSRFVSYADTLLSLDPGEKEVPVKRKKAAPKGAKSVRTAKG